MQSDRLPGSSLMLLLDGQHILYCHEQVKYHSQFFIFVGLFVVCLSTVVDFSSKNFLI